MTALAGSARHGSCTASHNGKMQDLDHLEDVHDLEDLDCLEVLHYLEDLDDLCIRRCRRST